MLSLFVLTIFESIFKWKKNKGEDLAQYVLKNSKFKMNAARVIEEDPNEDNRPEINNFDFKKKLNTATLGIVIYMTKSKYSNNIEDNKEIHFPYNNQIFGLMVLKWLSILAPEKVPLELVVNHEHGTKNFKCHKQVFIKFSTKLRCQMEPAEFDIGVDNFICMAQSCRAEDKLRNYCKKPDEFSTEPCFTFKFNGKSIKSYLDEVKEKGINFIETAEDKGSIYDRIAKEEVWNEEVFYKTYNETSNKKEREFMIRNKKQIFEFRAGLDNVNKKLEAKWHFPPHALKYMEEHEDILSDAFSKIKEWFDLYCVNNDPDNYSDKSRKKALLIYGPRGIGKTLFCRDLIDEPDVAVESSPFIVYCRQNIAGKFFRDKEKNAQLLLLDDVSFVDKHKEMLKALIVGNSVAIESKYEDNYFWKKSIPCIILTNEPRVFRYLTTQDIYKNEIYPIAISYFLGPPGTEPKYDPIEPVIDPVMQIQLEKYDERVQEWKEKQNAFSLLGKKHK